MRNEGTGLVRRITHLGFMRSRILLTDAFRMRLQKRLAIILEISTSLLTSPCVIESRGGDWSGDPKCSLAISVVTRDIGDIGWGTINKWHRYDSWYYSPQAHALVDSLHRCVLNASTEKVSYHFWSICIITHIDLRVLRTLMRRKQIS